MVDCAGSPACLRQGVQLRGEVLDLHVERRESRVPLQSRPVAVGKHSLDIEQLLHDAVWKIVSKAQDEPHFASMYAALCLKLSRTHFEVEANTEKKGKMFKKLLLTRCQEEFETDTAQKIAKATEGITEEEEIEFKNAKTCRFCNKE